MKTVTRAVAASGLIAGLLLAAAPITVQAQSASGASRIFDATTVNLSAFGEVKRAPDEALITLGVQSKGATAAEAMHANAAQMGAVMSALRQAGLPDKDIQTSNLNLSAQYNYQQNQLPRLTGYQASNDVTVVVDNLPRLGSTIDAVVGAGANQINGVSFRLRDSSADEDQARLSAVKALAAKADLYARATGYRVARLVSLSEGGGARVPVPVVAYAARMQGVPVTPVSTGELTVRVDVTAVYELAR